jgi:2-polyprenyl-3-methyl-5-hydroxy-6-metoxy-1,4-benzoquinol methylase
MPLPQCLVCGAKTKRDLAAEKALVLEQSPELQKIFKCDRCDYRWMHPHLIAQQSTQQYDEKYFEDADRGYSYSDQVDEQVEAFHSTASRFATLMAGVNVLDIGCATGDFLLAAQKCRLVPVGLDPSPYAIEVAKSRGLDASIGDFDDLRSADITYDGIHMSHVLEHVSDPIDTLGIVRRLLCKGGILYVEVPNQFNSALDIYNAHVLPKKTFDQFSIHHRSFFSCNSMRFLLEQNGFEILSMTTCRPEKRQRKFRRRVVLNTLLRLADLFNRGDIIAVWARFAGLAGGLAVRGDPRG